MLLDTILLSLGEVICILDPTHDVAIVPNMKRREAKLERESLPGGVLNYGVIEYEKDSDNDNAGMTFCLYFRSVAHVPASYTGRLIGPDDTSEFALEVSSGFMFLLAAKRPLESGDLNMFIPQAVALAMSFSSRIK
jgi:hypothetical protein